ncbi:APC family permease [Streptomyces sp. NPDC050619]|uniref:APC family permease n=1 Tax=Streptomyces sp. NPDC050619 TaxID=3157214 RepID=UPI00341F60CD
MTPEPTLATGPSTALTPSAPALRRTLGVGSLVFMVVAAAAPLTVVGGTVPLVFSTSQSTGVPAHYLIAAVVLTVFSVGFTTMSRYVHNAGAFYTYVRAGLGKFAGTGSATLALFSYAVLAISVYAYCGAATTNALDHYFGISTPWWVWTGLTALLVAWLGYRDIELSSKVLGLLLVGEVAVILILDVAVIARGGHSSLTWSPFSPVSASEGNPGIGLMFAFFGFIGFEATAVFRDETRDPHRTIPRATYIAVISIGLFYALSSWAIAMGSGVTRVVSDSTADPEGLVVTLAGDYVLPVLGDIIQVLLVTSLFACVLSFHNVVTRYQYALGAERVLPARLGRIHPTHGAPSWSSLVQSAVSAVALVAVAAAGLDPVTQIYAWLSGAATLGLLLLMSLTSVAVIVYFARHATAHSRWRTLVAPALALAGLLGVTVLVVDNFPLLVGGTAVAWAMAGAVALSFAVGVVLVTRNRAV